MLVTSIGTGLYRIYVQHVGPIPPELLSDEAIEKSKQIGVLSFMMLLRAFSSGAVALSGVEAVSNGVPAFQKPEAKNAATTLMWMGGILGSCFFGVSVLASHLRPFRGEADGNGLGLMAEYLYGGKGVMFWLTMIATFFILILAANTAYADFPRLAVDHRQGRLPAPAVLQPGRPSRVLERRAVPGRRGIGADRRLQRRHLEAHPAVRVRRVHRLHAQPDRHGAPPPEAPRAHWQAGLVINAIGAFTTGLIAVIVVVSKFTEGAWIPALLIPIMVALFKGIGRHYDKGRVAVAVEPGYWPKRETHTMVVLVGGINKGVLHGVQYARSLAPDRLLAVTVASDDDERVRLEKQWHDFDVPIELHTVYSPYREAHPADPGVPRRARRPARGRHHHRRHPRVRHVVEHPVAPQRERLRPEGEVVAPTAHRRRLGARPHARRRRRGGLNMHTIVVGCGRVGSTVARELAEAGHEVVVIDRKADAFRRLGEDFPGRTMTGIGFDKDLLTAAGISPESGVMAVTSGDNSNILIARVARETFGVQHVVARIYDPKRAVVYERLGIPTVASVAWTSARVLRTVLPHGTEVEWTDPTSTFVLLERRVPPTGAGRSVADLEAIGARVCLLTRIGTAQPPALPRAPAGGRRDPGDDARRRDRRHRRRPRRRPRGAHR